MPEIYPRCRFESGTAATLSVTAPTDAVSDAPCPLVDDVSVPIDGDQLIVSQPEGGGE
jgi:hypothetical protein